MGVRGINFCFRLNSLSNSDKALRPFLSGLHLFQGVELFLYSQNWNIKHCHSHKKQINKKKQAKKKNRRATTQLGTKSKGNLFLVDYFLGWGFLSKN